MDIANPKGSSSISEALLISQRVIPYLHNLGYQYLNGNVRISAGSGAREVDIVAYLDQERSEPYIIAEVKQRLPDKLMLLDPSVQQVFSSAVILGPSVRYLLVTDGIRHNWFERSIEGQSLVQLHEAPTATGETRQLPLFVHALQPVTDPEQFTELIQSVMKALFAEGVRLGLRMGIEINRILIAKLHDEQILVSGGFSFFNSANKSAYQIAEDIKRLYYEAVASLDGPSTGEGLWLLSPAALQTVVNILEPYALSTVTASVRSHLFWQVFSDYNRVEGGLYTTPVALAELLVQLTHPQPGQRVIDPACGSGLFLIEALSYMEARGVSVYAQNKHLGEATHSLNKDIVGVEWNAEVAELAATNFMLNSISYGQINHANALDKRGLENFKIPMHSFDVVLLDPPVGVAPKDEHILQQYDIVRSAKRATLEMLFIELAIELLRPGGLLACLVPDLLLSSPTYTHTRNWILGRSSPKAILSLPSDTFAPVGHLGKASILLLKKEPADGPNEPVLIADVRAIGYDKSGRPITENDLPPLINTVRVFFEEGQIESTMQGSKPLVWSIPMSELREKSWSVSLLNPATRNVAQALKQNQHPIVQLRELVQVFSGQSFEKYVKRSHDTAMVIQAGAVRDLMLNLSHVPYISIEDYNRANRAKVKVRDILVTTTGQYLGRACTIDELAIPAVAGTNVTILRLLPGIDIDPFFLAAVICSDLGKQQIAQKSILSAGRPYIRRDELGTISIPVPDMEKQKEIVTHLREMVISLQKLVQLTEQVDEAAKKYVITELSVGDDNV